MIVLSWLIFLFVWYAFLFNVIDIYICLSLSFSLLHPPTHPRTLHSARTPDSPFSHYFLKEFDEELARRYPDLDSADERQMQVLCMRVDADDDGGEHEQIFWYFYKKNVFLFFVKFLFCIFFSCLYFSYIQRIYFCLSFSRCVCPARTVRHGDARALVARQRAQNLAVSESHAAPRLHERGRSGMRVCFCVCVCLFFSSFIFIAVHDTVVIPSVWRGGRIRLCCMLLPCLSSAHTSQS